MGEEDDPRRSIEGDDALTIRELQLQDVEGLTPILEEWVRDSDTGEVIEAEVADIKSKMLGSLTGEIDDRQYLVAEQGGKVLGVIGVTHPGELMREHATTENPLEIVNLFVARESKRGGVGTRLLEDAFLFAEYIGATEAMVNSGPRYEDAWKFYDAKFGGRLTTLKDHYGPGLDAPVWSKKLKEQ